jgi:hypothetical protein
MGNSAIHNSVHKHDRTCTLSHSMLDLKGLIPLAQTHPCQSELSGHSCQCVKITRNEIKAKLNYAATKYC